MEETDATQTPGTFKESALAFKEDLKKKSHLHILSSARKQDSLLHFSEQISDFLIRERGEY